MKAVGETWCFAVMVKGVKVLLLRERVGVVRPV